MTRMRRLPFGPFLSEHSPASIVFTESDFVGKDRAFGERRLKREKRRLDLMRIEIDLRVQKGACELSASATEWRRLSSCA